MAIPTRPEDAQTRAAIFAAAGIIGALYAEIIHAVETEKIEPDHLRALALRAGREGMQACRRLKRAADGRP